MNDTDENDHETNDGISFTNLLTIAFIVLKLIGVIHWSWIWVLSPLWIPFAFILLLIVLEILFDVL